MSRGRVLARMGDLLRVRTMAGDVEFSPAGCAKPGDLVQLSAGADPIVVRTFAGEEYPQSTTEVFRLPQQRIRGLHVRAQVLREIRQYFSEQDFLEIEAPTLVPAPGLEVNIKALRCEEGYLITSPEFSMKRLLAGGLERIFTTARCFRSEEEGAQHAVEFTMLEWYRGWEALSAIVSDIEALVSRVAVGVHGTPVFYRAGRKIDVNTPWRQVTVAQACETWGGFTLTGHESAEQLRDTLLAAGIDPGSAVEWDDVFYTMFVDTIEPALALLDHAILLVDWPQQLAALARTKPDTPQWALRFEAYIGGMELANAFDELTDPKEQRARFEEELVTRKRRGYAEYPLDEKFLSALQEGLPPCAGIALGVDRLAMLAAGAEELSTVAAFVGDEL